MVKKKPRFREDVVKVYDGTRDIGDLYRDENGEFYFSASEYNYFYTNTLLGIVNKLKELNKKGKKKI